MVPRSAVGLLVSVLLCLLPLVPLLPVARAQATFAVDLVPEMVFGSLVLPGVSQVALFATNSLRVEGDIQIRPVRSGRR